MGCGGAVVFAAGFAEARAGELQARLVRAAGDMPVCGPNGNGIVSLPDRVALWGDPIGAVEPGPVAVISQSGNVAVNALASRRGLRLHTVVSCGNQAVLDAADFLSAIAERDGVRSVALYLEDAGDGARWCAALERCAHAGVRVAVLKAGTSRAGAAAAAAHTGALAGDARVFRALFEECGAAWTEDPHDLLEVAKALGGQRAAGTDLCDRCVRSAGTEAVPAVPGRGVAVMTCSGGDSAIAADLAAKLGVELPALAPATVARLEAVLPAAATAANPLDYTSLLWDDVAALRELGRCAAATIRRSGGCWCCSTPTTGRRRSSRRSRARTWCVASTLPELASEGAVGGIRAGLLAAAAPEPDPERIAEIAGERRVALARARRGARGEGAAAGRGRSGARTGGSRATRTMRSRCGGSSGRSR